MGNLGSRLGGTDRRPSVGVVGFKDLGSMWVMCWTWLRVKVLLIMVYLLLGKY